MRGHVSVGVRVPVYRRAAGGLVYTAMPNARTPATDFYLTSIDATSATFENPAHDLPEEIRYALKPDGTLEAIVSGAEGARRFTTLHSRSSSSWRA